MNSEQTPEIIPGQEHIDDINLNFKRLKESRANEEPVLEEIFEARMNRALDSYFDVVKFLGQATLLEGAA